MKNFKPGQKVVYTGKGTVCKDMNLPQINEIVTILSNSIKHKDGWYILEYQINPKGFKQCFHDISLEPMENKSITIKLREVKLEPKKVIESQPIHAQ